MSTENHTFNTLFERDISHNKNLLAFSINHFFEIAITNDTDLIHFDKYREEFENVASDLGYELALPIIVESFTQNFHRLWLRQPAGEEINQNNIVLNDEFLLIIELGCIGSPVENQMIQ